MNARPLRLSPGCDLRRELEHAVGAWPERSGFVLSGIGSLAAANLRFAAVDSASRLEEPLEILSLAGSVTPQGAHLHASVSTASGRVLGGHLGYGCRVRTTAEVLVAALPEWRLSRSLDPATGYAELDIAAADPTPSAAADLRRTWLFGPGAGDRVHEAMAQSGADVLIVDLEDFTPPTRRDEARRGLAELLRRWRDTGHVAAVRINALDADGPADLAAAMPARPDIVAYPMAASAGQMHDLHAAIGEWERHLGMVPGSTEILPVCETARGVADVRAIAGGSARIRAALLGAEDLAADLNAERHADAAELGHARRRFLLDCRAAAIEPIDAPYTFSDIEGAVREAGEARRLGYRCKALVRPEHARPLNAALTPSDDELRRATAIVDGFEAARAHGEDRALVGELWVEVPTYRNALRLIERGRRLGPRG